MSARAALSIAPLANGCDGIGAPGDSDAEGIEQLVRRLLLLVAKGNSAVQGPAWGAWRPKPRQAGDAMPKDGISAGEASLVVSEETTAEFSPGLAKSEFDAALVQRLLEPRYEPITYVGRGAGGHVWLVRDPKYRCYRVAKLFRYTRHLQELIGVGSGLSLGHAGLIDILGHEKSKDEAFVWYIMPPADDLFLGELILAGVGYTPCSLEKYLARHGALLPLDSVRIALELCSALAYLHHNGFVHRDLKPANVVRVSWRWQVADIGLMARIGRCRPGGTRGYIPPEGHGKPTGDVYSLGILLYQMVTGNPLPKLPTLKAYAQADGDLQRRLLGVVLKATRKNWRRRYPSAEHMFRALERIKRLLGD